MSSKPVKKFWWLKLDKDFFKRHDVRIIKNIPNNGTEYAWLYINLLTESVPNEGRLRFNEEVPYTAEMIAVVTEINSDIVRSALKVFEQLKLIEIWEDQTIYMVKTKEMIGSETEYARKKREYRTNQKKQLENPKTKKDNVRQELEKELELEQELYLEKDVDEELEINSPKDSPTLPQINFLFKRLNLKANPNRFYEYHSARNWTRKNGEVVNLQNVEEIAKLWDSNEFEPKQNTINSNMDLTGYDTSVGEV